MRRLAVLAVVGLAIGAAAASGGQRRSLDRCSGTTSWKYLQTLTFVAPNGSASFDPDPSQTYELIFSGYVRDQNSTNLTILETSIQPFKVNGQIPPLYTAGLWHRNHPLKDPSAFGILIQDEADGKSLSWDQIPTDVVPLPGTVPPNEPCTLASGSRLPGRKLSITPEPPPPTYTGTISIAVYKLVFGGAEQPPPTKTLYNATFSGSQGITQPTTRAGEERKWVSVSGSAQLKSLPDGQLQALGGGSYAGLYSRAGPNPGDKPTLSVRGWRFRVDSANGPPGSDGELNLNVTVVASGQNACPVVGAKLEIIVRDGPGANDKEDTILVTGGCVGDAYDNQHSYLSHAYVTIKRVGG